MKQTLTGTEGNTIIVGDFNTPLSTMDRPSRQKANKETLDLNYTWDQMDLSGKCKTFHPTAAEYTFSGAHKTFTRIDHMLGHKKNLSKFKNIKILQVPFPNTRI